jgi:hypothetical protein
VFTRAALNAEIALRAVKSVDDLARVILETGSPAPSARLAGAYPFLRDKERADQIISNFAKQISSSGESMTVPILAGCQSVKISGFAGKMSTATVGEHLRKRDAGEDAKASRSKAALAMRASSPLHFEIKASKSHEHSI